jgi:hypothetical protein
MICSSSNRCGPVSFPHLAIVEGDANLCFLAHDVKAQVAHFTASQIRHDEYTASGICQLRQEPAFVLLVVKFVGIEGTFA